MPEQKDNDKSSASLNGETDLEGKMIIDSTGEVIGTCKAVSIGDDGQIGLAFETEINGKAVTPSKTIPYSAISKITDVIELRVPINIKVAQSAKEILETTEEDKPIVADEPEEIAEVKEEEQAIVIEEDIKETPVKQESKEIDPLTEEANVPISVELPVEAEKLTGTTPVETTQADATEQLSKTLEEEVILDKKEIIAKELTASTSQKVTNLMVGLEESITKLEALFKLLSEGNASTKIEAIKALTVLCKISPELGLSLIPKMMQLSDESQQDVRLAVAQQFEVLAESNPELFKGYFLEILENTYEEPIEDIREHLIKALHDIAILTPEICCEKLEEFIEEVIIGKRVPEVPSKILHDVTLKVVSGNFQLTRIAIKVRLKFIVKGGKLAERCAEELEDYNAALIGLTVIESFSIEEAEKLLKSSNFKKLGPIFVEVIQEMLKAYKEGSFGLLEKVVDKKIEIPIAVIEKFYEIKIIQTLLGVKNVPMEVFLENSYVTPEEAEQIIYRLVVQKRINAAITMNNGRTFITTEGLEETVGAMIEKPKPAKPKTTKVEEKPKTTPKKTLAKAEPTTKKIPTKKTSTTKKTTASEKKLSTAKKTNTTTKSKTSTKSSSAKK
jgi:sporulation protein YlmC with PRC-barrel domain